MNHLFQMRREQFEVVGLLGLDPKNLGARGGFGETRNQRWRGCNGVVALPAHLAQIGEGPILHLRGSRLRALEQPRHFRRGQQGVVLGFKRRQLFASDIGTAARHHHRCVPAQQRQCAAKRVQAAKLLFQLLVRRGGHETLAAAVTCLVLFDTSCCVALSRCLAPQLMHNTQLWLKNQVYQTRLV